MMSEIKQIESIINPTETILVADSLTGQVAASVAKEFKNTVNLSGIILTRADGDARGGAAVSMKFVSQVPIKFLGIGEKIDNFEAFHPDRIANSPPNRVNTTVVTHPKPLEYIAISDLVKPISL